jgi:methylase of polypeptide subunit release factors
MTIQKALLYGQQRLQHTSDAPDIDAEALLTHALGISNASWLFSHYDDELTSRQKTRYTRLIQQRQTGKPLAYIY